MPTSRKLSLTSGSDGQTYPQEKEVTKKIKSSQAVQKRDSDVCSSFKRTEVIGRGKFGIVYKGYHMKTKHVYAIKVLNLDSESDEVEDVQREIQFLASLKQVTNITRYYGSYLKGTNLWIIMEYCAGGSLRTLLRPGKIDEKYIGVIMRELLTALQYVHKDNVIHRDIKAANVLITNEGKVKLCDFGVAAQLNQTSLRRQTMAGTPYWMAPEVIMEGVYYDTKVDIWSLGITAYEIATGNPPYCEIEALRAMQLISKSKPARLEGRNYSSLLKEFIALCLDEDPKERLSAEELHKSKFIRAHRSTSTSVLKELISIYLLFRDKTNSARESAFLADDGIPKENNEAKKSTILEHLSEAAVNGSEDIVDVKWDFDSLSSSDYIIENDINIDAIPEEATVDWSRPDTDQFNYAYPDEEPYFYFQTNNNTHNLRRNYQDSTIGKYLQGSVVHNSTINAPFTNAQNTNHFTSKAFKTNHVNTGVTGTHGTNTTSNKNTESRATKQLLQLFEENDVINEEVDLESEIHKMPKAHTSIPTSSTDSQQQSLINMGNGSGLRPSLNAMAGSAFHSQSTPSLPVLQTKFNKNLQGLGSVVTTAPTPIEIEIPEELPLSAIPTPKGELHASDNKIPSSSGSILNVVHPSHPALNRRLTVSGSTPSTASSTSTRHDSTLSKPIVDDSSTVLSVSTASSININPNYANKLHRRTPSPPRNLAGSNLSPSKKIANSPKSSIPLTAGNALQTMKPIAINGEVKDIMLQSINGSVSNLYNNTDSTKESEGSRVTRDFKRNNPNLKLQMPSPTTVMPNRLLDSISSASAASDGSTISNENINQFGFNTSSASNIPVSMTPIHEKHIDFGSKLKRTQSVTKTRSNTVNDIQNPITLTANSSMNLSTNSINSGQSVHINSMPKVPSAIDGTTSNGLAWPGSSISSFPLTGTSNNESAPNTASTAGDHNYIGTVMQPPPSAINMNLFSDFNSEKDNLTSNGWVDRKPQVLEELEKLLKMYEENLPALENSLKKQLSNTIEPAIAAGIIEEH